MRHILLSLTVLVIGLLGGCGTAEIEPPSVAESTVDVTPPADTAPPAGTLSPAPQPPQPNSASPTLAPPATDTGGWREFSLEHGKFVVLVPGVPEKEQDEPLQTALGTIEEHSYITKVRQDKRVAAYMISYSDYPPGTTKTINPNDFLEKSWQGGFSRMADRLVYKKTIALESFAGLEFQIKGKGNSDTLITGRNYLVNDRIYQLSAITPKAVYESGDATKYLDSFRLLK